MPLQEHGLFFPVIILDLLSYIVLDHFYLNVNLLLPFDDSNV